MLRKWTKFKRDDAKVRQPVPEQRVRSCRVAGQPRDDEFTCFCPDARYVFFERIGMLIADGPLTAAVNEIARADARAAQNRFLASL